MGKSRRVLLEITSVLILILLVAGASGDGALACSGPNRARSQGAVGTEIGRLNSEVLEFSGAGTSLAGTSYDTQDRYLQASRNSCGIWPWEFVALTALDKGWQFVLLGEVHDNPMHHRLRGAMMAVGSNTRVWRPVVFEHIRADQQPGSYAHGDRSAADLLRFLDWDKSGWPDKSMFAPLFAAVISDHLPIYAGDPLRKAIKDVAKEGETALPEAERKRLGLEAPFPATLQDGLVDDLEKSHCGLMPKSAFGNLAYAQRYRDAHLADAMLRAGSDHGSERSFARGGAILFAGNGHVRKDRGVPWYIRQRAPDKKVVSVMLLEVEDGKTDPEAYVERDADGQPVADFIVFTPRHERPDPCIAMKKAFGERSAPK